MEANPACHKQAGPGSLALVNKLYKRNVMQYIVLIYNLERDLLSANRSETLSLRERSALVPPHRSLSRYDL
ncbi:hypothetical protein B1J94_11155 [Leptospira kirschneri serovar Grippotyphosa]|nr:hypothetical protein B1J94_11155 [Leptospira kirschneri serovar Grippotyphosa]